MDLHLYIRRGVYYTVLAAVISSIYALTLAGATLLIQNRAGAGNLIAVVAVGTVVALVGQRLRDALGARVDRLFDRQRYDYRRQLLEFSGRITGILDPDELAQAATELVARTMGARHARLYLYEPAGGIYHFWAGAGTAPTSEQHLLSRARDPRGDRRLADLAASAEPVQRLDAPAAADALLVPLTNKGQPVGLLTLSPKKSELPYSSEDLALLRGVANQLAVTTENAQLYGRMRDLYISGIRTLAATVDAKDSYTHGHSERVAAYARAIAEALGLRQLEVETIELAGLLHDIGKIGVPDAVLLKPGRLDPDERALIMQHAALGAKILADNPALLPLVPLVRHHHERWDGGGYPDGLAGEAIPLGAAIIAAADTFDTMTTNRPYRAAPGWEKARAELARCSGSQFHPRVAD